MTQAFSSNGSSPRILFALTPRERNLFFDGRLDPLELNVSCEWPGEGDLAGNGFEQWLERYRPDVLVTGWSTPPLPRSWLLDTDCPLRYVCHVTGSVRRLVPRAFLERGGHVTNWGNTISSFVAEHALLLALAALRNQANWRSFDRLTMPGRPQGQTSEALGTRTLFDRRIGFHGFGGVARSLLPLLRPFNVSICAYSHGVPADTMKTDKVTPCDSLTALFAQSEILFECEALTPATEGSVSAEVLAALPNGAVFVNVARGKLVDEGALQREGESGRIRLALDVVSREPLTSESRYLQIPDAVLSPHIAGPTYDRYPQCGRLALANLHRFLRGESLPAAITPEVYDRAT